MPKSKDPRVPLREWLVAGRLPQPSDAEEARDLAHASRLQGLAGLLHAALPPDDPRWPSEVRDGLRDVHRGWLLRGVRQLETAGRVQALLAGAGIRALPLKGAALAERLYDAGDRPMQDVDLLVLDDWDEAVDALVRADFREEERADHACAFRDPESGTVVELHHSLTSCPGFFPFDREGLWARSVPGDGQVGRLPGVEDLLTHLALHAAFQHGLGLSLVQYLDFRRLLERSPPDPIRLVSIATELRAGAALVLALEAAEVTVGGPHLSLPGLRSLDTPPCRLRMPLRAITPDRPSLLRVRFRLASGRRWSWLRLTLAPPRPGRRAPVATLGDVLGRAVRLAGHLGLSTLRRSRPSGPSAPAPGEADTILRDCLASFPHVRLRVTGDCMSPALAPGDTVLVAPPRTHPPRLGDVVLASTRSGLRLHRLVWGPPLAPGRSSWLTQADRADLWDARLRPDDVLGTVFAVEGKGASPPRRWGLALRVLLRGLLARGRAFPRAARAT